MKTKLLLIVSLLFLSQNLFSQEYELASLIIDESGAGISGVTINDERNKDFFAIDSVNIAQTVSYSNYWVGAKVGYNFVSDSDEENFIGSIVSLNMWDSPSENHGFSVVGNIGDFKFTKDSTEVAKIQKLAQSINGVSIGLGYQYKRNGFFGYELGLEKFYSTLFITSLARFTTYKNIGIENQSVNFVQNVNTVGAEFALDGFKKKGQLTLTLCSSLLLFDPSKYELIFEHKKDYLVTYEATLIIPLQDNIGFFVNGTFSAESSALFSFGIAVKQ